MSRDWQDLQFMSTYVRLWGTLFPSSHFKNSIKIVHEKYPWYDVCVCVEISWTWCGCGSGTPRFSRAAAATVCSNEGKGHAKSDKGVRRGGERGHKGLSVAESVVKWPRNDPWKGRKCDAPKAWREASKSETVADRLRPWENVISGRKWQSGSLR